MDDWDDDEIQLQTRLNAIDADLNRLRKLDAPTAAEMWKVTLLTSEKVDLTWTIQKRIIKELTDAISDLELRVHKFSPTPDRPEGAEPE